jgi:hypothetical protein
MVKGNKRKEFLRPEDVYAFTDGGYDIFRYYLRTVGRVMNRPWGKREKHPSWGIFKYSDGYWYYKDQANGESGTALQFVQKFFNLEYKEAMIKICFDFGLGEEKLNVNPVKVTWETPDADEQYSTIDIISMPFKQKHHDFWNIAEVTEEHCKKMNCFAVKKLAINGKYKPIPAGEIVFAYYCPEFRSYKIYFPERSKGNKFRNNVPGNYLWNIEHVEKCEKLIVQKSNKDLTVTSMLTDCVVANQNESAGIFDQEMVDTLNGLSKSIWIWYGSDPDGVKKCQTITATHKWNYINTPKFLLPDVNDTYSFVKMHNITRMGTGLKELEKFMQSKNLL